VVRLKRIEQDFEHFGIPAIINQLWDSENRRIKTFWQ